MRVVLLLAVVFVTLGCGVRTDPGYPDWRRRAGVVPPPQPPPADTVLLQDAALPASVIERLGREQRLLVMIPGVDSGILHRSIAWTEALRVEGGYGAAVFYDWLPASRGREVLNAVSTRIAGEQLAAALDQIAAGPGHPTVDVLAHSGGTVVLRKAMRALDAAASELHLRNVVFTGTPVSPDAVLDPTLERSAGLCNVVSSYDHVIRTLSDHVHGLPGLGDATPDWNLRMDRSLTGLVMRHMSYLADGPEMRLTWAALLRDGRLPRSERMPDLRVVTVAELDRHARWLRCNGVGDLAEAAEVGRDQIGSADPDRACYGIMIAGLARDHLAWPEIDRLLRDPSTPAFVRREAIRYMANLRDGAYIPVLEWMADHDPDNAEAADDALRELKRARVVAPAPSGD